MAITVGIDPGSRITGYGVVEYDRKGVVYTASGIIKVKSGDPRALRLVGIKRELDAVLKRYKPSSVAVEDLFIAKNPRSSLALGEARGVILLSAAEAGIPVFEYSPREVKSSVTGRGSASKDQVASLVLKLLKSDVTPSSQDETDALAVAFCHALRDSGIMGRLP